MLKSGIIRESSSSWRSRQFGSKVYDQGNATFIDSVSIYDARLMRLQTRTVKVSPCHGFSTCDVNKAF